MKIRYKNNRYKCSIIEYIKISFMKKCLILKRVTRFIHNCIPVSDIITYFFLVILWSIFIIAAMIITEQSLNEICHDIYIDFFTSVVVLFGLNASNHIYSNHMKLKRQHHYYVSTMDTIENIFELLFPNDMWSYYHPFYNETCYKQTMEYFNDNSPSKVKKDDLKLWKKSVEVVLCDLEYEIKNGFMQTNDEEILLLYIRESQEKIRKIINKKDVKADIFWNLFMIIELIRYPWRRDQKYNSKIINILYAHDENDIKSDFYLRMHLDSFKIEYVGKSWI